MNVLKELLFVRKTQLVGTPKVLIVATAQEETAEVPLILEATNSFVIVSHFTKDGCVHNDHAYPNNATRISGQRSCNRCHCNVSFCFLNVSNH